MKTKEEIEEIKLEINLLLARLVTKDILSIEDVEDITRNRK